MKNVREVEPKGSLAPSIESLNTSADRTLGNAMSNKSRPNFWGKPSVSNHEALLERLRYLAYRPCEHWEIFELYEERWPQTVQECQKYGWPTHLILAAMIQELVIRICDTVVPEEEAGIVYPKMLNSLQRIRARVGKFSRPAERDVEKAIAWIRKNYS